ncbi:DUF4385 domain-containing protein [Halorussus halophilus]|uniref:DUF4385 domain-containing protein n=1 Tax=Halorussus halophilus TaxID=2650975 RepID=UPI0013010DC7|nr:DUF4385 domain-containing protein [Halorussus halophilus]
MSDDTESGDPEYDLDFREHPEAYYIGRGEQGVFKVQPYKSELLPNWTIKNLDEAEDSAEKIYDQYQSYKEDDDFVGMDMARKYLQMGYTRAMRYAKYPGGQKYEKSGDEKTEREPQEWADEEKREIALVFEEALNRVREDEQYQQMKADHRERTD